MGMSQLSVMQGTNKDGIPLVWVQPGFCLSRAGILVKAEWNSHTGPALRSSFWQLLHFPEIGPREGNMIAHLAPLTERVADMKMGWMHRL